MMNMHVAAGHLGEKKILEIELIIGPLQSIMGSFEIDLMRQALFPGQYDQI